MSEWTELNQGSQSWTDASEASATWSSIQGTITVESAAGFGLGGFGMGPFGIGETITTTIDSSTTWTPFTIR